MERNSKQGYECARNKRRMCTGSRNIEEGHLEEQSKKIWKCRNKGRISTRFSTNGGNGATKYGTEEIKEESVLG